MCGSPPQISRPRAQPTPPSSVTEATAERAASPWAHARAGTRPSGGRTCLRCRRTCARWSCLLCPSSRKPIATLLADAYSLRSNRRTCACAPGHVGRRGAVDPPSRGSRRRRLRLRAFELRFRHLSSPQTGLETLLEGSSRSGRLAGLGRRLGPEPGPEPGRGRDRALGGWGGGRTLRIPGYGGRGLAGGPAARSEPLWAGRGPGTRDWVGGLAWGLPGIGGCDGGRGTGRGQRDQGFPPPGPGLPAASSHPPPERPLVGRAGGERACSQDRL